MDNKLPRLIGPALIVTFCIFTIAMNVLDTIIPIFIEQHHSTLRLVLGLIAILLVGLATGYYIRGLLRDVSQHYNVTKGAVAYLLFKKVALFVIILIIFFGVGFIGGFIHSNVTNSVK